MEKESDGKMSDGHPSPGEPAKPGEKKHRTPLALRQVKSGLRRARQSLGPLARAISHWRGETIDRNQWRREDAAEWASIEELMALPEATLRERFPEFSRRMELSVAAARGRVLEVGCGPGLMTRWLAQSPAVTEIVAIDAFTEAIDSLSSRNFPRVRPMLMKLEELDFSPGQRFDTVTVCEVIEHLYPEEEATFIRRLLPFLHNSSRFVVSTPIGWMPEPYHVRGFSKRGFRKHLNQFYGAVDTVDYSAVYSQVAWGKFHHFPDASP